MTLLLAPDDDATRRRQRRRLILGGVLGLIALAALLTPELIGGRTGDPRLTTFSAQAQGARLLYELASRLGWRVARWTTGPTIVSDAHTVVAVLDPVQPVSAIEAHDILQHVRAGGGLLYVMNGGAPLDDSLHVKRNLLGGTYEATAAGTAEVPRPSIPADSLRARHFDSGVRTASSTAEEESDARVECVNVPSNGGALPMWFDQRVQLSQLRWARRRPPDAVIFARATDRQSHDSSLGRSGPAAAGFSLGSGRVVVLADADLLRNDVLRVCRWGLDVVAVRMLDYLATGGTRRDRLVFDEYHQGFGAHPGTLRAIIVYLSRAASGHVLLQLLLGGLVLLAALGPRALPPHDAERVERRSPLEHVGALAQAYARVGATRTATARLLRGVRRRIEPKAVVSDEDFLQIAGASSERAADVALIRHALAVPVSRREFAAVGGALGHLEESLLAERR